MTEIIVSDEALEDLSSIEQWLTQPGAAKRASRRFQAVQHPTDRFNPKNRQLVVQGYVVSYRFIRSAAGSTFAVIE